MTTQMSDYAHLPEWLAELVQASLNECGGKLDALAAQIHMSKSTISEWRTKTMPGGAAIQAMLNLMAWAPPRPKGDFEGYTADAPPTLKVRGAVAAGAVGWHKNAQKKRDVVAWPELWKSSSLWGLTNPVEVPGEGFVPVVLVEVYGNSMEPHYMNGEIIACRTPKDPWMLPDSTPCIINEPGQGETFKLLRFSPEGQLVGLPINKDHAPIVFDKSRDLRVKYVAVGKFDPGSRSVDINNIPGVTKGFKK